MWKQHWKSLGLCFGITVGIIIFLLIITSIFEYLNIHVPGSREMWIGLTGAVIGGAYTMFGVLITIFKQEEETNENLRLSNLPVLGFKVLNYQPDDVMQTISFIDGELSTTANPEWVTFPSLCSSRSCRIFLRLKNFPAVSLLNSFLIIL